MYAITHAPVTQSTHTHAKYKTVTHKITVTNDRINNHFTFLWWKVDIDFHVP